MPCLAIRQRRRPRPDHFAGSSHGRNGSQLRRMYERNRSRPGTDQRQVEDVALAGLRQEVRRRYRARDESSAAGTLGQPDDDGRCQDSARWKLIAAGVAV
jgi:hypothetical protein